MSKTVNYADILLNKINKREAKIGIIGLGYVGLPLSMAFAQRGFQVIGVDVSHSCVQGLQQGHSHISDVPSHVLQRFIEEDRFSATTDFSRLREVDVISICVPTPLRKTRDPDISYIVSATEEIARHIQPGQLVILESTTYPGTTREIVVPKLEKDNFRVGQDFFAAFSPERVDPGNPKYGIRNTPKVVGGVSENCTKLATACYQAVVDKVVPVSSAEAAEVVKLLENTFRAVNIALVNEFVLVCEKLKIDTWEVIKAAASKPFGFMPFYPGPGLGGHCIPIDPHYLAWKLRGLDYRVRFIELADEINRAMPEHVVAKIAEALNDAAKPVKGSKLLLLGMAYKKDVSDIRESPSLDIARMLHARGAKVAYYDPYVGEVNFPDFNIDKISELSPENLRSFAAVVITTDHSQVDYPLVLENAALVVDTRNVTHGLGGKARIWKL